MRGIVLVSLVGWLLTRPAMAQEVLEGTWRLISSQRTNAATGVVTDSMGPHPRGFIMYGRDGRMMVLMAASQRPQPASIAGMTDAERAALFGSMVAYTGTYQFDGHDIVHHIDLAWNEVWGGTAQVRHVTREGNRLIYRTDPAPAPIDGSMGFGTLIWEKIE